MMIIIIIIIIIQCNLTNGIARDQIFSVVGRFPIIQVLGIKLKISEL